LRIIYIIYIIIILLCRVPLTPCITRDRRRHRLSSRRRRRFCAADRRCRRRRRRRATHHRRKFCNRRRSPIAPGRDAWVVFCRYQLSHHCSIIICYEMRARVYLPIYIYVLNTGVPNRGGRGKHTRFTLGTKPSTSIRTFEVTLTYTKRIFNLMTKRLWRKKLLLYKIILIVFL